MVCPSGVLHPLHERLTCFCSKRCNALFHARTMMNRTAEQFWSPRVAVGEPSECWDWTGYRNPSGYGQMAWMGKLMLTHRIAKCLTDNDWDNELLVCHSCDRPACCNPAHLWRGTQRQNHQDMIAKGRGKYTPLRGEQSPRAKLTATQVSEIRTSDELAALLAERYGVSLSRIHTIRSRSRSSGWTDVANPTRARRFHSKAPLARCRKGHELRRKA